MNNSKLRSSASISLFKIYQGHTVGHAVTGMFSGGSTESDHVAQTAPIQPTPAGYQQQQQQQTSAPCAWEIKQFLQCAQQQDDLSLCSGFNEAVRQCKEMNG